MKEVLPPGYEDPDVNHKQWFFSRFNTLPTPEESQRWQGRSEADIEKKRVKIMMKFSVDTAMDSANRLMLDSRGTEESFTPVY